MKTPSIRSLVPLATHLAALGAPRQTYKPYSPARFEAEILPYPLQRRLVRSLAIPAEAAGRSDLMPLWAGQSANLSACADVSAFLTSLIEEVSEIAGPVIKCAIIDSEVRDHGHR